MLHQPLLQSPQQAIRDSSGQRRPSPEIALIVGQRTQGQVQLILNETGGNSALVPLPLASASKRKCETITVKRNQDDGTNEQSI
jgi:hypothetical protein